MTVGVKLRCKAFDSGANYPSGLSFLMHKVITHLIEFNLHFPHPKFYDRSGQNRVDPDQTDQNLHCLPFRLYSTVKPYYSNFRNNYSHFFGCPFSFYLYAKFSDR